MNKITKYNVLVEYTDGSSNNINKNSLETALAAVIGLTRMTSKASVTITKVTNCGCCGTEKREHMFSVVKG